MEIKVIIVFKESLSETECLFTFLVPQMEYLEIICESTHELCWPHSLSNEQITGSS